MKADADFQAEIGAIEAIAAVPTILSVVCKVTGMGYAAVARVTEDRWVCVAAKDNIGFGLGPGGELNIETTICREVRQLRREVIIDDVAKDAAYCDHPTPAMYGFQSYISMPIFLRDGSFYGTLCAIDPKPAQLNNPATIGMFRDFADLIANELDAAARVVQAEQQLLSAGGATKLREQFIAVLGHDLRNPVAAIAAGIQLLQRGPLDEKSKSIVERMQRSIARTIALIDDVMDLARGRLGGGIALKRSAEPIEPYLLQVVDEMRTTHPGCRIETEINISRPVRADHQRIARVLSNLLSNAIAYGNPDTPVWVRATANGEFELSVTNEGSDIPTGAMKRLFAPFTRGETSSDLKGSGLGLYIVSVIASAHGGSIDATSAQGRTCFRFRIPLDR